MTKRIFCILAIAGVPFLTGLASKTTQEVKKEGQQVSFSLNQTMPDVTDEKNKTFLNTPISFCADIKDVFVRDNVPFKLGYDKIVKNLVQTTEYTKGNVWSENVKNIGEFMAKLPQVAKYIWNWNDSLSGLYINDNSQQGFNIIDTPIKIKYSDNWTRGCGFEGFRGSVLYTKDYANQYAFQDVADFRQYLPDYKNFYNSWKNIGVSFCGICLIYGWTKYIFPFTLNDKDNHDFVGIKDLADIKVNTFNIDNLLDISSNNKELSIKLNDEYLCDANRGNFIRKINKLTFNIDYEINDILTSGKLMRVRKQIKFDDLNSVLKIKLNKGYDFYLDNISFNEYDDSDTYISSCSTSKFKNSILDDQIVVH